MPASSSDSTDVKMLPAGAGVSQPAAARVPATGIVSVAPAVAHAGAPARQLSDLPKEELEHLAEEFGVDPTRHKTRQDLVAAIHDRRQMIAGLDREAMLDVVRWGRRPVTVNATNEQIAQE